MLYNCSRALILPEYWIRMIPNAQLNTACFITKNVVIWCCICEIESKRLELNIPIPVYSSLGLLAVSLVSALSQFCSIMLLSLVHLQWFNNPLAQDLDRKPPLSLLLSGKHWEFQSSALNFFSLMCRHMNISFCTISWVLCLLACCSHYPSGFHLSPLSAPVSLTRLLLVSLNISLVDIV